MRATLRKHMRDQRKALSAQQRIKAAEQFAEHLLASDLLPDHGYLAGYWAMDGELGLHALQLRLPSSLIYCLPVIDSENTMKFAPWKSGDPLATNRYGIPEPTTSDTSLLSAQQLSMAIVPLVAFDRQCHRLGMGGGYYDRSFSFRHTNPAPPVLVGAAFSIQHVEVLPCESWDVVMDAVCTEQGIITP